MALNVDVVVRAHDRMSAGMKKMGSKFDRFAKRNAMRFQRMGAAMTAAGAAISAGMGMAVKEAMSTRKTLKDVEIQSGATAEEMAAIKESAGSDVMENLGKSAGDVAKAYRRLAAQGYEVAQMKKMMIPIMQTSKAMNISEADATKLSTQLMNQYGYAASEVSTISDHLAGALATTTLQGQDVADALSYAGVGASNANISLSETIGMVDLVNQNIKNAQRSGRYLNKMFSKIQSGTPKMNDALEGTGVKLSDLQAALDEPAKLIRLLQKAMENGAKASDMFGESAKKAVLSLVQEGNVEEFKKIEPEIDKAGAAADAAEEKANTAAGTFDKWKSKIANIGTAIGDILIDKLAGLGDRISPILDDIQKFIDTPLGKTITTVVAAIGGLLTVVGPALTAFGLFLSVWPAVAGAITGPIGIAIGAIIALGYAAYYIYSHWEGITQWWRDTWTYVADILSNMWDIIVSEITGAWDGVVSFLQGIWDSIVSTIRNAWNGVISFLQGVWDSIVSTLRGAWNRMVAIFAPWIKFFTALGRLLIAVWNWIWSAITDYVMEQWNELKSLAQSAWNYILKLWKPFANFINKLWKKAKDYIARQWRKIRNLALGAWNFIKDTWGAIDTWFEDKFDAVKDTIRDVWDWIKNKFTGIYNTAKEWGSNIAAGVADGLRGALGLGTDAMNDYASRIEEQNAAQSPAKKGPLRNIVTWGENIVRGIASGMEGQRGHLLQTFQGVVGQLSGTGVNTAMRQIGRDLNMQPPARRVVVEHRLASDGESVQMLLDNPDVRDWFERRFHDQRERV